MLDSKDNDDDDDDVGFSIPSLIIADISFIKSNTLDLFIFNSSTNESSNSAPTSRIVLVLLLSGVMGSDRNTFGCSSKAFDFLKFDSALIRTEY